jgi:hypothetical protein
MASGLQAVFFEKLGQLPPIFRNIEDTTPTDERDVCIVVFNVACPAPVTDTLNIGFLLLVHGDSIRLASAWHDTTACAESADTIPATLHSLTRTTSKRIPPGQIHSDESAVNSSTARTCSRACVW